MPAPARRSGSLVAVAFAAASLLAPLPARGAREPTPATPEDATRAFYARVIALHPAGVPDGAPLRQIAPLVSRALANDLRAAADAERRHRTATRNREPPLWEGDVFSSLFEGPREASVERCIAEGDRAQCVVSLAFRDAFGGSHRWQDRAVLVRERGRWVVDDVAYEARWAFGNKGTLRAGLRDVAARAPAPTAAGRASRARGR